MTNEVIGHSTTGEWNIEKMELNDPEAVNYRTSIIYVLEKINIELADSMNTVKKFEAKILSSSDESIKSELSKNLFEANENITKLRQIVAGLLGNCQP